MLCSLQPSGLKCRNFSCPAHSRPCIEFDVSICEVSIYSINIYKYIYTYICHSQTPKTSPSTPLHTPPPTLQHALYLLVRVWRELFHLRSVWMGLSPTNQQPKLWSTDLLHRSYRHVLHTCHLCVACVCVLLVSRERLTKSTKGLSNQSYGRKINPRLANQRSLLNAASDVRRS